MYIYLNVHSCMLKNIKAAVEKINIGYKSYKYCANIALSETTS